VSGALRASFYDRPVVEVARDMVGCLLTFGECSGVIVETEAYHFTEPACHAFAGLTPRTEVLHGGPGLAYVYRSYGIHALLNAVCEPEGVGAAVLIRAVEPLTGLGAMRARRELDRPEDLCSGPGKLTQAFGIGLDHNGSDLTTGPILVGPRPPGWERLGVAVGPRIGITRAMDLPWRFCARRSPHVSRPWPPSMRRRGVRQGV
jgi:DNA-3-methyladenine glycosylase